MKFTPVTLLNVSLIFDKENIRVGRLALHERRIYFEYDPSFIERGLEISPFNLSLKPGVQTSDIAFFGGLPGVFNDSLPDGWGRLLLDRQFRRQKIDSGKLSLLDQLAHVGKHGMGSLVYEPDYSMISKEGGILNLDHLSAEVQSILTGDTDDVISELLILNGSSAGARPKAMIAVAENFSSIIYGVETIPNKYKAWLVKFANSYEDQDCGAIEYAYSQMATAAGLEMMTTHLFPAKKGAGYFAVQRFDRDQNKRLHMHSAAGLLNSDFRIPSLDYKDLLNATLLLTKDQRELEKMFRLSVFNVLAHNRDDHSKNFSFLMDANGQWRTSPPYDLSFSHGPGGEQSTMVLGEGRNPGVSHLLELATTSGIKLNHAKKIITEVSEAISLWPNLAKNAGVRRESIQFIQGELQKLSKGLKSRKN